MFGEFFRFELRFQLRQPLLWVVAAIFGLLAFGMTASDAVQIGGAIGNVFRNAPSTIVTTLGIFTLLGMFLIAMFIAGAMLRDHELGTADLFFASPIKARDYLLGRFFAGCVACLLIYAAVALGMVIAQFMPWIDPKRLGPFSLQPFVWAFAFIVLPNLLFSGALLALLSALTRGLLAVYIGILAFFVLWLMAGALTQGLDNVWVAALIDPFGVRAMGRAMRYWSTEERNTLMPELAGFVLANRALWGTVAVAMVFAMLKLFSPTRTGTGSARKGAKAAPVAGSEPAPSTPVAVAARPRFDGGSHFAMFRRQLWFDTLGVVRSVPFLVMALFAVVLFLNNARFTERLFETEVYPVTYIMLDVMRGNMSLFLFLIVVFFAGELVFRERQARLAEVVDAMPVPNLVPLAAKCGAMLAVVLLFAAVNIGAAMLFQLANGYTRLEPGVYFSALAIGIVPFVLIGWLAIAVMVYTQQKFLGFLVVILVYIAQSVLVMLHFDHNLYIFASSPSTPYSAMNGWGHYLTGWAWFSAYWTLFTAILLLLAAALWVRGVPGSWRERARLALAQLRGPLGASAAVVGLAWVGCGAWIAWNTLEVNTYRAGDVQLDLQARYEREYRQYKDLPQPKVRAVRADVDLWPERLQATIRGEYRLQNPHPAPISELHVLLPEQIRLEAFELAGATLEKYDEPLGYRIYRLGQPLAPGAETTLSFALSGGETGFGNDILQTQVVDNGSFFNSSLLPSFGYDSRRQIVDRNERRKRDLGEPERMPKLEDEAARMGSYLTNDADWIDFASTICTAPDQIALAPGYLEQEFTQDGRRCFRYSMQKMLPFFAWLSARWEVKRDSWNGIPIEVYFDPAHAFNVDRMIAGAKDSLDYFTREFTPYQHRQLRILEFPRYARFAQSFANTIPYSESIGFIADLRDPKAVDYVYYVTAHEVAHQWWAHQVIGANMQGSTMLSESLAQYSALMVMERKYGRQRMRKFLRYELDNYLSNRGGEVVEELPLYRVENQPYIHYRKGSLVFYRLREEIGEETLNRALSKYLVAKGFQSPPYTTSLELLEFIRAEAGPQHEALIVDLFEKISFYDNRVLSAKATQRADGKYEVNVEVQAGKRYSDGLGKESPGTLDDWIEFGVFSRAPGADEDDEAILHLERVHVTGEKQTLTAVVDGMPYEAGFDPYNKLIDRVPGDNRKRVEM